MFDWAERSRDANPYQSPAPTGEEPKDHLHRAGKVVLSVLMEAAICILCIALVMVFFPIVAVALFEEAWGKGRNVWAWCMAAVYAILTPFWGWAVYRIADWWF